MKYSKKSGLSRGLKDLFRASEQMEGDDDILKQIDSIEQDEEIIRQADEFPTNSILSNPFQPRLVFNQDGLRELAHSIEKQGLLSPIILKQASEDQYYVIAGERRLKAVKDILNKPFIKGIVINATDIQMQDIALIENIHRENLNPLEEGRAYEKILNDRSFTQEQLSQHLGKSRSYIANTIRMLKLPYSIQQMVLHNQVSMGHVKPLITIDDEKIILGIAERIMREKLSVRQVEDIVRGHGLQKYRHKKLKSNKSIEILEIENFIRAKLQTKIDIGNNKIQIKYKSNNDLNRILELLGFLID